MANDAISDDRRYWAFISYSHRDAAFGHRLHRKLESYVLPRHLTGADKLPRRLVPIFRDREELAAAGDLSAEVRAALAQSRSLIVVCSPHAAASQWVGREVALFRELHPDRPILAAIREGEPAECFPEPLRRAGDDGTAIEPLAADFRRGRDGEALGLLKLVAGMAGVGLDALVQRDAQRNFRRVTAVTATALVAMLVMAGLTGYALYQRSLAEGLVGYMSTDLREKLRGTGRSSIMSDANRRALQYYDDQGLLFMGPQSRGQRALLLQAVGEDNDTRGDGAAALAKFQEAYRVTVDLLAADPDNPERIYEQAQSEAWFGLHAYGKDKLTEAERWLRAYQHHAERLVDLTPADGRALRELGYAEGDLCSLYLQPGMKRLPAAIQLCGRALKHMEAAARAKNAPNGIAADLSNRHSWMGSVYRAIYDNARAQAEWKIQERLLSGLMKTDRLNPEYLDQWTGLQRLLSLIEIDDGRTQDAIDRLTRTARLLDDMTVLDPANKRWAHRKAMVDDAITKLESTKRKGLH